MMSFFFQMPGRIEIGYSKSLELAAIVREQNLSRVLIIADHKLREIGLLDCVLDGFHLTKKVSSHVFDGIKNEPTIQEVNQAIKDLDVVRHFDVVVGIGGGSSMDFAKLLAVSGVIKGSIENVIGTNLITKPGIPTIMIPTTSGTGAEITPNAIVRDEMAQTKKSIVSPYLIPKMVIIDPGLTISLPPKYTAETGLDAFTHAIECFTCNKANPISDLFALDAVRLISANLKRAVSNGQDKEARYNMAIGSLYGGIAITNSGTGGVHALAYPLGGKYGISHGLSNAVLLAEVLEFNAVAVPDRLAKIAAMMEIETTKLPKPEAAKQAVIMIRKLISEVGVKIENLEIAEKTLNDLAGLAMDQQRLLKNNPRPIGFQEALAIYRRALTK